jgi:peptidoglycan/LPS O-acetylase OafA/YrhL
VQREIFDITGVTLLFGAIMWFLLARPMAKWLAPLRLWPFYLLSRLSFGMYLNHEYMHDWVANLALKYVPLADRAPAMNNIAAVAMLTLLSAAVAVLTFCAVEYPFLRLRSHLLSRNTRQISRAESNHQSADSLPEKQLAHKDGDNRNQPITGCTPR